MNLNAYDLIILHKNVNRIEGREIFSNNTLANNDKDVLSSLEKLIKEDILIKTNQFEISIQKKKLTELRGILKENNFKTTGTKQVLIDLIRDNFNNIGNLELPYVYVATDKGEITLTDTEYLLTFISDGISLHRAYHIAENYLDENCEDKVVGIYKYEFKREYKKEDISTSNMIILEGLVNHYLFNKKDYASARKYLNIMQYFQLKKMLDDLLSLKYTYYDDKGNFIPSQLEYKISPRKEGIYERLIFIQELSNKDIYELFKKDVENFNDLEDELTIRYINYIIAMIRKENESNAFIELIELLKSDYTLDKEEFEEIYDYNSSVITMDIKELVELKSQIEVEINIESGRINFFLDDDSLEELINEQE